MAGLLLYVAIEGKEAPLALELDPSATVGDLRKQIENAADGKTGWTLEFAGETLKEDGTALADAGVCMEATVQASNRTFLDDFTFDPELHGDQIRVLNKDSSGGGKMIRKPSGYSWAACTLQPPIKTALRGTAQLQLRLVTGHLSGFGAIGITESSVALDKAQIGKTDNWSVLDTVRSYYWALGWNDIIDTKADGESNNKTTEMRGTKDMVVSVFVDTAGPSPHIRWQDGTGKQERVEIEVGPEFEYNFFVCLNDPENKLEIIDDGQVTW
eukprot:Hpha_TRINITY_DN13151_c0_g3::TRINITY_DN13151_c0_g3_i1::g.113703::m.113703